MLTQGNNQLKELMNSSANIDMIRFQKCLRKFIQNHKNLKSK